MGKLYVIGETIQAETSVVESLIDGKLYAAGPVAGTYVGDSVELLREGFRARVDGADVREDDA